MPSYDYTDPQGKVFTLDVDEELPPDQVYQRFAAVGIAPITNQRATTDAGYLSQLGSALSIGARQMASGVKATFNAATGDVADTAEAMAKMGALQNEQQANLSPEDVALNEAFEKNKAEYDRARGVLPTIGALSGYIGSIASQPGAAFKQAVQSAPNAAISAGTGLAGYALGGLLGAGAGVETGPGAILTGIAGAAAGGAVSNSLMEAGPAIYDILNERTNGAASSMTADQITQVLQQNPDIMSEGLKTGAIRGSVIGVIESLGMKGAGRLMSIPERAAARAAQKTLISAGVDVASKEAVETALLDPALKSAVSLAAKTAKDEFTSVGNLARLAGAAGLEIGTAGAGEVGAQVATGQEIDPTAAVQEMMGEVGLSIPVAAVAKGMELAETMQNPGLTAAIQTADNLVTTAVDVSPDVSKAAEAALEVIQSVAATPSPVMEMPEMPVSDKSTAISPSEAPIADRPSPNLPPRAEMAVEPRPARKGRDTSERDAWDEKYGVTHNEDGTPYQPTIYDETVAKAFDSSKQNTFDQNIDSFGVDSGIEIGTAIEQLLNDGWVWDETVNKMVNPANPTESPSQGLRRIRSKKESTLQPQPIETTPDATLQREIQENRIEERLQADEGRQTAETGGGNRPVEGGEIQEKVEGKANGGPIIAWRGIGKAPSGAASSGLGFFAADSKEYAKQYAADDAGLRQVSISIDKPYLMGFDEFRSIDRGFSDKSAKEISSELKGDGYDGIIVTHNDGSKEYIAFSKDQIVDLPAPSAKKRGRKPALAPQAQSMLAQAAAINAGAQKAVPSTNEFVQKMTGQQTTPQGAVPTPATEGKVMPGGSATVRDLTKDDLVPLDKPRRIPNKGFYGEVKDDQNNWVGDLWKDKDGNFRVYAVDNGRILAESPPIPKEQIKKSGGLRLSAGQSVQFYKIKLPQKSSDLTDGGRQSESQNQPSQKPVTEPETAGQSSAQAVKAGVSEEETQTQKIYDQGTSIGNTQVSPEPTKENRTSIQGDGRTSPSTEVGVSSEGSGSLSSISNAPVISFKEYSNAPAESPKGLSERRRTVTESKIESAKKTALSFESDAYIVMDKETPTRASGEPRVSRTKDGFVMAIVSPDGSVSLQDGAFRPNPQTTTAATETETAAPSAKESGGSLSASPGVARDLMKPEQMTLAEFRQNPIGLKYQGRAPKYLPVGGSEASRVNRAIDNAHFQKIEKSLQAGNQVPLEVMKDYTGLLEKFEILYDPQDLSSFYNDLATAAEQKANKMQEQWDAGEPPFIWAALQDAKKKASILRSTATKYSAQAVREQDFEKTASTLPDTGGKPIEQVSPASLLKGLFGSSLQAGERIAESFIKALGKWDSLTPNQQAPFMRDKYPDYAYAGRETGVTGNGQLFATLRLGPQRVAINSAIESRRPVSSAAVDTYGITLPEGYVKQGDLYIFQPESPQTTASETQTPAASRKVAGASGSVQAEPVEGSIPTVKPESPVTAIESTEKTDVAPTTNELARRLDKLIAGNATTAELDAFVAKLSDEQLNGLIASEMYDVDPAKLTIKPGDSRMAIKNKRRTFVDSVGSGIRVPQQTADKIFKEEEKELERQRMREELALKTLNSLIEKTRTNVVQGAVKPADAQQAISTLNRSGEIPNVLFTWIGTSKDFLADPANKARYPKTWKAVSANSNIEGMSENGQPIVFTDNVGVSDLDRKLAKLQGTTPEVAAVRRVIIHENIHKGMFFLSLKEKMKLFQFLHRLYSPEELDALAKSYDEYADWRTNQVSYFSIIEEAMTRDFDSMVEIPRDGIWAEFMQFLREIWQKITGKTSEPKLKDYKDVFRLIRNSLKNSEKVNADRLKNGGAVRMSMGEFISNVTPEQDAAYAKAVADGDMETAQRMVDESAKAAGYDVGPVYHGTEQQGLTEFFGGWWSDQKATTKEFGRQMYSAFLRGPLAFAEDLRSLYKDFNGTDIDPDSEEALSDSELGDAAMSGGPFSRFVQEKGFQGIAVWDESNAVTGMAYAVFDPSQIKSADPVTRDADGNVIPLSRRFQAASPDIRFSYAGIESLVPLDEAIQKIESFAEDNEDTGSWPDDVTQRFEESEYYQAIENNDVVKAWELASDNIRDAELLPLVEIAKKANQYGQAWDEASEKLRKAGKYSIENVELELEKTLPADVIEASNADLSKLEEWLSSDEVLIDAKRPFIEEAGNRIDATIKRIEDTGRYTWDGSKFEPIYDTDVSVRFSKVEYDSPNEAAFNSGAEVARNTNYDERDKAVRSAIRAAYDLAPKPNGPSVPLDQLFDLAKQSIPDLTEAEFSQILQDLYEDSGALLQAGEVADPMSEQDRRYLEAVESDDMATAQRMVDEAAKAAGFNVGPVWHGSPDEEFTIFQKPERDADEDGFWFSKDREWASKFGPTRLFYIKNAKTWGGDDFVVKEPNSIKSADPVTRDDSGNVIPLSRRFDTGADIRGQINVTTPDGQRAGSAIIMPPADMTKNDVTGMLRGMSAANPAPENEINQELYVTVLARLRDFISNGGRIPLPIQSYGDNKAGGYNYTRQKAGLERDLRQGSGIGGARPIDTRTSFRDKLEGADIEIQGIQSEVSRNREAIAGGGENKKGETGARLDMGVAGGSYTFADYAQIASRIGARVQEVSNEIGGGLAAMADGNGTTTILVNTAQLSKKLAGISFGLDEDGALETIGNALVEELIHAADLAIQREAWIASGRRKPFAEFAIDSDKAMLDEMRRVVASSNDSVKATQILFDAIQASRQLYEAGATPRDIDELFSSPKGNISAVMSEFVRQMIQQDMHQTVSEASLFRRFIEHVMRVLQKIRDAIAPAKAGEFGDILKNRINETEMMLALAYQQTGSKASKVDPESAASKEFAKDIKEIESGSLKAAFAGRQFKDFKPIDRTVKPAKSYQETAINYVNNLEKESASLEEIANSVISPAFLESIGIEQDLMAQDALGIEVRNRVNNAYRKEKNPVEKRRLQKLDQRMSAFWQGVGSKKGAHLGQRSYLVSSPRYSWMFMRDAVEKAMKERRDNILIAQFGENNATDFTQNSYENADTAKTASVNENVDKVEMSQDDIDLEFGETILDGEQKTLWERTKDWIRELGIAMRHLAAMDGEAKKSVSDGQRNAISRMSRDEVIAFIEDRKKKISEALKQILGDEAGTNSPVDKMVKIAKKRANKGLTLESLDSDSALAKMLREINKARRGAEVPLKNPIPWRKLLSQDASTVEEYRQRIFESISANEELKAATPEQKARLADLFSEAWESNRKRILDSMLERMIREQEAKKNLSEKGAKALQEQRMRIVEDINLGIFDNDELAKIMAEKFGIKSEFTDAEREKIESLVEVLQDESLNRVKRNKAAYELLETLSAQTDIPIAKLLANFWVSSVLSGMNTVFSIGMAVFSGMGELTTALSRIFIASFSNPKQLPSELAAAFKTLARVLSAVPRQANRAWQYLVTGDQAFLDPTMNDALKNMDWDSIGKNNQLAEQMAKSDKILEKSMGLFMRTVSRLLTALDLFNSGLTKEGSLSIVFRQLDLGPEAIAMLEKRSDLKPYKAQVIQDYFGNVAPKTAREKALVDSYAMAEMMKALDEIGNVSENADQMAMQGAMTLDPSGVGGYGYRAVKSLMKSAETGADKLLERNLRKWDEAKTASDKTEAFVKLGLSYLFQFAAYNAANLVGVRFARFAGNKFNQSLSFLPGLGALRLFEAEFDSDRVRGKEAFTDMIKRNQLTGLLAAVFGYYVLKAIADEPDDEERGWFINGGWSNLTPEKKQQKLAAGEKEYTIGMGGKVFNYANWPGSGIIAAIGSLSDLIRFSPEQWNDKTVPNKLLSATTSGVFSALEVPALSQFQELFGSSLSSKDPNEQKLTKFARVLGNYAGGFMPRILKDLDYLADPNLRKYETLWEKTASHIPVYRRYAGQEYYDILGQQIQRNIYPGSREFMTKPTDPAYKILGALNSRGIWLTPANAEHRMVGKGARRRKLTQEEADNYGLETGKGYKQMLLRYGQRALQMPTERARDFLLEKANDVRDKALKKVYRGYTPAN